MRCSGCGQDVLEGEPACTRCGESVMTPAMPAPPGVALGSAVGEASRPHVAVGRLGRVTTVALVANALVLLVRLFPFDQATANALGYLTTGLFLVAAILVLVWCYRARTNVAGRGRQRRARGWAVGGWFCPVVNLWFPLQIMSDIENADLPPGDRIRAMRVRGLWWTCWLAAWLTATYLYDTETTLADGTVNRNVGVAANLGDTLLSKLFGAAAAVLLAVIVYRISTRQEAARTEY